MGVEWPQLSKKLWVLFFIFYHWCWWHAGPSRAGCCTPGVWSILGVLIAGQFEQEPASQTGYTPTSQDPALALCLSLVFLHHLLPPEEGGRIIHNYLPHAAAGKLVWEPTQSRKVTRISPGPSARTGTSESRERSRKASRVLQ